MVAYSVELCWRPWPGDQVWVVRDVAHPRVHLEGPNQKEDGNIYFEFVHENSIKHLAPV